ncbi:MAG: tetratricopeptide repeat protein, partial [Candidatus Omnitrophica bacterium]|nr:tetratricopeptide repeat protein [Candidatus Omnitrophota bacterium]
DGLYIRVASSPVQNAASRKSVSMVQYVKNAAEIESFAGLMRGHFCGRETICGFDFGAGTGINTLHVYNVLAGIFKHVEFCGLDNDSKQVELAAKSCRPVREYNVTKLRKPADLVTIFAPMPEDLDMFIRSAERIVKRGGLILVAFDISDLENLLKGKKVRTVQPNDIWRTLSQFSLVRFRLYAEIIDNGNYLLESNRWLAYANPLVFVHSPQGLTWIKKLKKSNQDRESGYIKELDEAGKILSSPVDKVPGKASSPLSIRSLFMVGLAGIMLLFSSTKAFGQTGESPGLAAAFQPQSNYTLSQPAENPTIDIAFQSNQQVELAELLKDMGYPETEIPELVNLFEELFEDIDYARFQKELQTEDTEELKRTIKNLMLVLQRKGYLNTARPKPLLKFFVNALTIEDKDIFELLDDAGIPDETRKAARDILISSCTSNSQLVYVLLKLAGLQAKGVISCVYTFKWTHVYVLLPTKDQKFLFIDFANRLIRTLDIFSYYQKEGAYWVLKPEQRISLSELKILFEKDWNTLTDLQLLNLLSYYFYSSGKEEYPFITPFLHNLGITYAFYLGKYAEAAELLEKASKLNPDDAELHKNLGFAYGELGKGAEAIKELKEAVRLNPNDPTAHYNLGIHFFEAGMYDDALRESWKAAGINPDDAMVYYNIGFINCVLGKFDEALKPLQKAMSLNPDYPPVYKELGLAYDKLNRNEDALRTYQTLIKFEPDNADLYFNMGVFHTRLNQIKEALKNFQEAVKLKPELLKLIPEELRDEVIKYQGANFMPEHEKEKTGSSSPIGHLLIANHLDRFGSLVGSRFTIYNFFNDPIAGPRRDEELFGGIIK